MSSPVQIQASQRALCLPEKCHSCNYLSICGGGCRLEAYSFYGDIYRETSLCPEYQDIFTHIEKRIEREKGDVTDWWFSLCDSRAETA
jgi:sulfatase maturation enzyme AslB (radical SAM superfamily)